MERAHLKRRRAPGPARRTPSSLDVVDNAWTQDFSNGEVIRSGNDQNLTISPCNQLVYQGINPGSSGDYLLLPWRMGLLSQTNSTC